VPSSAWCNFHQAELGTTAIVRYRNRKLRND